MAKKIVAIATGLGAILALIFLVFPRLKPEPPPKEYGATIKVVNVEPGIRLLDEILRQPLTKERAPVGEYIKRYGEKTMGAIVFFECTVKGQKDTKYPLRWTLYDATTKTRFENSNYGNEPGWPTADIIQKGSQSQLAGKVWVPYPKRAGSFFVRLELKDPASYQPLAYADSPAFDVPSLEIPSLGTP